MPFLKNSSAIGSQITNYNNSTNYSDKGRLQKRGMNTLLLDGTWPPKIIEHNFLNLKTMTTTEEHSITNSWKSYYGSSILPDTLRPVEKISPPVFPPMHTTFCYENNKKWWFPAFQWMSFIMKWQMQRVWCPPETAFHFYKYVIGNTSQVHNWPIMASHLTNFFCSLIVFFLCTDLPLSNASSMQESISSHTAPTALADFPVQPDWKHWLETPFKYVPHEEAYLIYVCNWWEYQQFLFVLVDEQRVKF